MKVKIRTGDVRFSISVPAGMIGFAVKLVPEIAFEEMRAKTPKPYRCLITKENCRMLLEECVDIMKDNKGLEIVHVEGADGTLVHIRL